ncbi:MAG: delta-aminolevulinic acid dehydratase [Peptococcaceae bacterium BICA1-8]|nr:MAG: delta-aminolevulinic acid dehydratase [Peptococcaceae bacterium BICA1-8]
MGFPITRMRRLRKSPVLRDALSEVAVSLNDLIYPMFAIEGKNIRNPVLSMPGVYQYSPDILLTELENVVKKGIKSIILFGIPEAKDAVGSSAYAEDGIIQQTIFKIKKAFPEILLITDVCLCEYTDHGHCGLIKDNKIVNDTTLELLAKTALTHAQAGADIVAPSDMMDGRVAAIRKGLDGAGYEDTLIMAYSVKYASAFYGPFRDAAGSTPQFGDRGTYQMDPRSSVKQAIQEAALDIEEGADIVIVKPAFAYMDIIKTISDTFNCPVASYNVSGEYAMVKAAAEKGWIDEKKVVLESMTGLKRSGSNLIITYHALDIAAWLQEV